MYSHSLLLWLQDASLCMQLTVACEYAGNLEAHGNSDHQMKLDLCIHVGMKNRINQIKPICIPALLLSLLNDSYPLYLIQELLCFISLDFLLTCVGSKASLLLDSRICSIIT